MLKRVIKNQLRNTGMFKELEVDNENLRQQIISLEKDYLSIKNQLMKIQTENERLLAERTEMVGYSLNFSLRGLSPDAGKSAILKFILENIKKDAKILDVGFGSGVYGKLLRAFYYQNIDGIDIYGQNIEEMGLNIIYDHIFIENILDFNFDFYDLIIMGDVLEHIELESAKNLLSGFIERKKCRAIVISIPYEYEQDELYGNHFEKHLQPDVTSVYMEKHYPYLKLIDSSIIANSGHTLGVYVWIDK